jgi:hypothetical protein
MSADRLALVSAMAALAAALGTPDLVKEDDHA